MPTALSSLRPRPSYLIACRSSAGRVVPRTSSSPRQIDDAAGHHGILIQVPNRADPVVPVSDDQRDAASGTAADQQDGREQLPGVDLREVGHDVSVVSRKEREAAGAKQVLRLSLEASGGS